MSDRVEHRDRLRALEFEAFVAGAGGRLLHTATLLTGEPPRPSGACPRAERLLRAALARTYADWDRLHGGDPYDLARRELVLRFAREARRHQRPRGGLLERLSPLERLVLVLRMYEEVGEEQAAALLGLPGDRVRAVCARAVAALRSAGRGRGAASAAGGGTERPAPRGTAPGPRETA
ncbi:sigma factor-like helix-turn-helix DNA-binding protein [Streptomyces sp. NPDC018007]|uniref:sigma factor-like helix-turn-helix DNA-binding protein n=1 Tax=Streptomyces sp. NPDC018007 TaxID=3365029 RepID=UPI0037B61614